MSDLLLEFSISKWNMVSYDLLLFMLKIETKTRETNPMPFLVFRRDHLRPTSGIICGSGSFATLCRGPFLEIPGNSTSPKSYFEIKVSRKVKCVLTSNEVHFVSLAVNFTVQFSNLLKISSGLENKTA